MRPVQDTFPVLRRGAADTLTGVNVQVTVPGFLFPDRWIVLTAHYDHVGVRDGQVFNGADDNASGTAALLALAEYFRRHPPRHSLLLAFLDAEERGLQGARHLVAESLPGPEEAILVNVNLDMVGHSDGELWVTGTTPYPALRPLVEVVDPAPPAYLVFGHDTEQDTGADNWINASDHAAFHRRGIPFLYFGVADHPDYHRPTDDTETLNPAFLTAATETVLRVVEQLDTVLGGARPGA
jgi:Zn-dependent M28 family amino/carboxypeptidase